MPLTADQGFRNVADYAFDIGFTLGILSRCEANQGEGSAGGVTSLRPLTVEWRDVPASELDQPVLWDIPALCRAADDYAGCKGLLAEIPDCHQATCPAGQVFDINLIPPGAATFRDVIQAELSLLHEAKPDDHRIWFLRDPSGEAVRALGDEVLTPNDHRRLRLKAYSSGGSFAEVEVEYQQGS